MVVFENVDEASIFLLDSGGVPNSFVHALAGVCDGIFTF